MRALITILLLTLSSSGCGGEDRGDGKKGTFAGSGGGPSAFGNNANAPSFGENGGSAPSFGENGGSASAFGENGSNSSSTSGDPTQACAKSSDCPPPSNCTGSSKSLGFCVASCTLTGKGDVEGGLCPGGLLCLRNKSGSQVGVCLRQCNSAADCPTLTGLTSTCASAASGQKFCVWFSPTTTETPPSSSGSAG